MTPPCLRVNSENAGVNRIFKLDLDLGWSVIVGLELFPFFDIFPDLPIQGVTNCKRSYPFISIPSSLNDNISPVLGLFAADLDPFSNFSLFGPPSMIWVYGIVKQVVFIVWASTSWKLYSAPCCYSINLQWSSHFFGHTFDHFNYSFIYSSRL